jgi:hypothetical protein
VIQFAHVSRIRELRIQQEQSAVETVQIAEQLCALVNHLRAACRVALDGYSDMTVEQFTYGEDRDLRVELVRALNMVGDATPEERREYGIDTP